MTRARPPAHGGGAAAPRTPTQGRGVSRRPRRRRYPGKAHPSVTNACRSRALSSTAGRAAAAALIAIALLGAAACGGNRGGRLSKSEYEAKLGELAGSLSGDLAAFAAFDPSDLKAAPAFMRRLADTLDDFASSLSPIEPPRAVEGQHLRLIEGARSGATSIRRLAQKLEHADEAQAKMLLAQFSPSRLQGLRELQKAAAELAATGYRVNSTGGT